MTVLLALAAIAGLNFADPPLALAVVALLAIVLAAVTSLASLWS